MRRALRTILARRLMLQREQDLYVPPLVIKIRMLHFKIFHSGIRRFFVDVWSTSYVAVRCTGTATPQINRTGQRESMKAKGSRERKERGHESVEPVVSPLPPPSVYDMHMCNSRTNAKAGVVRTPNCIACCIRTCLRCLR